MGRKGDLMSRVGPPPVVPTLEEQLDEYLLRPDLLPIHRRRRLHFWPHVPQPLRLLRCDLGCRSHSAQYNLFTNLSINLDYFGRLSV